MSSKSSSRRTALAVFVLFVISVFLISIVPVPVNRVPLGIGLGILYGFAIVWYLPHLLINKFRKIFAPAATYFVVGTVLICLGCGSSALYPAMLKNLPAWQPLSEVMLLVLGAVVGGGYCSDAILGIEFEGKSSKLNVVGALAGSVVIFAFLMTTIALYDPRTSFPFGWMAATGLAPGFVALIMHFAKKKQWPIEVSFLIFICGSALIIATLVLTKILLEELGMRGTLSAYFFSYDQAVNIIKNLVPSYCSAIGAGMILRGVQQNLRALSLDGWARHYFTSVNFESANGNTIRFTNPSMPGAMPKTIELDISPTVRQGLETDENKRREYGEAANKWLNLKLELEMKKGKKTQDTMALTLPSADKLMAQFPPPI